MGGLGLQLRTGGGVIVGVVGDVGGFWEGLEFPFSTRALPTTFNFIIPAAEVNGIVTPFPRAAATATSTATAAAAATATAAATSVDGAFTASCTSRNGRVLTTGGRALEHVASDAVLISINFWDGGYSEGWGLGGSWGRGIRVRVRIVVEVRGLG